MNIQAIDLTGLIWAAGFVALIAALSWLLRLGLVRTLLIAATRTYVQLMLLGYALVFIFAWDHPLATGVIFGLMMLFSTHTILSRLKEVEASIFIPIFFAVFAGGFAITLAVTAVIIRIEPFWQARYWLPLG